MSAPKISDLINEMIRTISRGDLTVIVLAVVGIGLMGYLFFKK